MRKMVSQDRTLFLHIVEHENFSVMFKVSEGCDGQKSVLVFYVDGEWALQIHDVSSLEDAQRVLESPNLRSVLGMTEEDASAICAKLHLLFSRESLGGSTVAISN